MNDPLRHRGRALLVFGDQVILASFGPLPAANVNHWNDSAGVPPTTTPPSAGTPAPAARRSLRGSRPN